MDTSVASIIHELSAVVWRSVGTLAEQITVLVLAEQPLSKTENDRPIESWHRFLLILNRHLRFHWLGTSGNLAVFRMQLAPTPSVDGYRNCASRKRTQKVKKSSQSWGKSFIFRWKKETAILVTIALHGVVLSRSEIEVTDVKRCDTWRALPIVFWSEIARVVFSCNGVGGWKWMRHDGGVVANDFRYFVA